MKKKIIIILVLVILLSIGFFLYQKGGLRNINLSSEDKKEEVSTDPKNFTHPDLGFDFFYPPEYTLTILNDGFGESILIQKDGRGLQLYITDFSGTTFNSYLVKKEITDVKLENVTDIELPSKIGAVSFSYKDPSLGEVWNVWFVKDKKLYQITSQAGHDEALKMFVETFKF